jgi:outer membrane protein assembly factor BamB
LNDYVTFGYDNQRDAFNPNSAQITPTSVANLHLAWQATLNDYNTQTQPVLATEIPGHAGVLFVGGGSGKVYAYDALTGAALWSRPTGRETYSCENGNPFYFGIGGTVAYDPGTKSLYAVGNSNTGTNQPGNNTLFRLDGATGNVLGEVSFGTPNATWPSLDFAHTSVTLANGIAYVGTSATCDISSWRGRLVAIDVPAMSVLNAFFPLWNPPAQPWGGGGVWGWGGASLDFNGNVFFGVGNADDGSTSHGTIVAPFTPTPYEYSGLGESFVELSSGLAYERSEHPIPASQIAGNSSDLDLNGTPTIFKPLGAGCDTLAALQSKSGSVYIFDTTNFADGGQGPVAQFQLAPSSYADGFLGSPAYSPVTGLLYVDVASSNESLYPPGMVAIDPGCGNPGVRWHAAFGPDSYEPGSILVPGIPRSVPAVSAGGVVLVGTGCTPSGNTCSPTTTSSAARRAAAAWRLPLICCSPPGTGGGAVWALDAQTGEVLNGGTPLIITAAALRMPPTIDGDWIFVLDNSGDMYALTLDPNYAATQAARRAVTVRRPVP